MTDLGPITEETIYSSRGTELFVNVGKAAHQALLDGLPADEVQHSLERNAFLVRRNTQIGIYAGVTPGALERREAIFAVAERIADTPCSSLIAFAEALEAFEALDAIEPSPTEDELKAVAMTVLSRRLDQVEWLDLLQLPAKAGQR